MNVNIADIVLLIVLLLGGYNGFKKGLLREVIAIIALMVGLVAGSVFLEQGTTFLTQVFNTYSPVLSILSFLLIFVCAVLLITLIGKALKTMIDLTPLGFLDGAGGAIVGVFKWVFIISVFLWALDIADIKIAVVEKSAWYNKVKYFAPLVIERLRVWFPALESLMKQIKMFLESLKS